MKENINISKRLQLIASFIPKGAYFADIGSDHAYLPIYVCLNDEQAKAIAGEVNKGPFTQAKKIVETYNLLDKIDVCCGDGLEVIKDEPVTCVIIAGMGGSLIKSILERGKKHLKSVERLILQPNIDERGVRKWLLANHYQLTSEKIIYENKHFYEILVAQKNKTSTVYQKEIMEKQLLFGPFLMKEKNDIFKQKWKRNYEKLAQLIIQMEQAKNKNEQKINDFKRQMRWIKEVIE